MSAVDLLERKAEEYRQRAAHEEEVAPLTDGQVREQHVQSAIAFTTAALVLREVAEALLSEGAA